MIFFVDFETYYNEKEHYSLKYMPTLQYIRDPRFKVLGMSVAIGDGGETKWVDGYDNCKKVFDMLPPKDTVFVAHNASFDAAVVKEVFGFEASRYVCTMFMARYLIAQGGLPYDIGVALKDLAPMVDSEKLHLDEALADGTLDTYAIRDTDLCRKFYYKYVGLIPDEEFMYIDTHVRMSALPKFVLDEELLKGCAETEENRAKLFGAVRKDDFLVAAFERLGVKVEYKTTPKGKTKAAFSKTDDFMKSLLQHEDKRVAELARLRLDAYSTCERSKAQRFLDVGSPLACPLIYYGAATGRTSGAERLNVQNMPRGSDIRVALRAPADHKLVIIDSSQIEVRVLGFLAGENKLLDVFRRGEDIYKHFGATELFHKPIDEITKEERQMSKPPVLAAGFGQSGLGLAAYAKRMGVDLSPEMAERCVQAYRSAYPAITGGLNKSRDGYWQRTEQQVRDYGYTMLPSGRKITYPNLRYEQGGLVFDKHKIFLRDTSSTRLWHGLLVENAVQATARDLVFWQVQEVLRRCPSAQPALMVHDEAVFVVPDSDAEACLATAEECFKSAPEWASGIPVQGEGHISDCYDK